MSVEFHTEHMTVTMLRCIRPTSVFRDVTRFKTVVSVSLCFHEVLWFSFRTFTFTNVNEAFLTILPFKLGNYDHNLCNVAPLHFTHDAGERNPG